MTESLNDQEKTEDESNDEGDKSKDHTDEDEVVEEANGDLNVENPACKDLDEDDGLATNLDGKPNSLSEEKQSSVENSNENKNSDEITKPSKESKKNEICD